MIRLTRTNHQPIVVNCEAISYVESDPDTLVTLANQSRVRVLESVDEVLRRTIAYKAALQFGDPLP